MATINSIRFNLSDWSPSNLACNNREWVNRNGDVRILNFFPAPDPPPCDLNDLGAVRSLFRNLAAEGGGALVEADFLKHGLSRLTQVIFKYPQEPTGMTYLGSLMFELSGSSYCIKTQCTETGMTGLREAVVSQSLGVASPGIGTARVLKTTGNGEGWFQDPYDPTYRNRVLRCKSDDAQWDGKFPAHPLSRLRGHMAEIIESLSLEAP